MAARAWDPAAGTGDSDAAYAFIHAFSRAYGGDPKAKASCDPKEASTANAATTATKTRVLVELKALAAGAVPAAGATRQLACALGAGILHAVGEVSDAARDAVDDALVAGKLRWMLDASDSGPCGLAPPSVSPSRSPDAAGTIGEVACCGAASPAAAALLSDWAASGAKQNNNEARVWESRTTRSHGGFRTSGEEADPGEAPARYED